MGTAVEQDLQRFSCCHCERMVTLLVAYVSVQFGSFLIRSTNPRWALDMGGWRDFLPIWACQDCIWRIGTWQCFWACVCLHACSEHQEIKSSSKCPVDGQRSSPLCSLLPESSLQFSAQTEGIIFSRAATDVHHHSKALHAPEIAELHTSTRSSGQMQIAQPPMKHLPHTCGELWQSCESGQFVDSCLPRREVLIISWGWCEVVSVSLRTIQPHPSLFHLSLFVPYWTKRTPLGRMLANVQTSAEYLMRPQWHRESVNGYL